MEFDGLFRTSLLFFFASWSGVFSHYSLRAECSCLKLHGQYAGDLVNWYVALLLRLMCPPSLVKRVGRAGHKKIHFQVVNEKTVLSFVFVPTTTSPLSSEKAMVETK